MGNSHYGASASTSTADTGPMSLRPSDARISPRVSSRRGAHRRSKSRCSAAILRTGGYSVYDHSTSAVEIVDNWHVSGLRGTGSCNLQVHDLFVPEEHALPAFAAKPIQPGTLYATPMITTFAASIP